MEGNKYIEIRCPHCGKLVAKTIHVDFGIIEFMCTRNSCKSVFYVVNGEIVDHPSIHIEQIFKNISI